VVTHEPVPGIPARWAIQTAALPGDMRRMPEQLGHPAVMLLVAVGAVTVVIITAIVAITGTVSGMPTASAHAGHIATITMNTTGPAAMTTEA